MVSTRKKNRNSMFINWASSRHQLEVLTVYISHKRAISESLSMVSDSKNFISKSQSCPIIIPFILPSSDDVQPLPPKCIKKSMPGSPDYASMYVVSLNSTVYLLRHKASAFAVIQYYCDTPQKSLTSHKNEFYK